MAERRIANLPVLELGRRRDEIGSDHGGGVMLGPWQAHLTLDGEGPEELEERLWSRRIRFQLVVFDGVKSKYVGYAIPEEE